MRKCTFGVWLNANISITCGVLINVGNRVDRIFLSKISIIGCRWLLTGFLFLSITSIQATISQTGEYAIFSKNDKKGLRDHRNKVLIPATYDDLGWSAGGLILMEGVLGYKENGLWGLVNLKNRKIISPHYTQLHPLNEDLIIAAKYDHITKQDVYGIINIKGNTILSLQYHHLESFNELIITSLKRAGTWKYGLLDQDYQTVMPYLYDNIKPLNKDYAIIKEQGKLGLINHLGQIVVSPKYQEIQLNAGQVKGKPFDSFELKTSENKYVATHVVNNLHPIDKNLYLASGPNGSYLINTLGSEIKSFASCQIGDFTNGIAIIRQGPLFGVVDTKGKLLVPLEYDSLWIDGEYIGIRRLNLQWMLLNSEMVRVTQKEYQEIKKGHEGLFPVKRHGSWGFINTRGVEVIPPQYEAVRAFMNGVAHAKYGGSWGLINRTGDWVIMPRYYRLEEINPNTYLFQNGRFRGLLHTKDGVLYETANYLSASGTAIIEKDQFNRHGLISLRGDQLLTTKYQSIKPLEQTPLYFHYQDSLGPGLFNVQSRTFIKHPTFQELRTINEEFIGVKINNQYGFIDLNGKLRIANRYQNVGIFSETMSPIKINSKWGYINRLERLKIQPLYDSAGPFENGSAIVSKNGKYGVVDLQGKIQVSLSYDKIERLPAGRFKCYQGEKKGLANNTGKMLLSPKYDEFQDLGNGFVIVSRENKFSLVSDQGVSVIPMVYDDIQYDIKNDLYILLKKQPWETVKL